MSSDNIALLSYTTNITAGSIIYTEKTIANQYISLTIIGDSDVDRTITIQFSGDGKNWDYSTTTNKPAGSNTIITNPVQAKWVRLRIQNSSLSDSTYNRVYVYGTPNNSSISASIQKIGNLSPTVSIDNFPRSGFGELMCIQTIPDTQYVFSKGTSGTMKSPSAWALPYPDIKSFSTNTILGTGCVLNITNGMARFGNSFTTNDRATLYGSTYRYRPGQGVDARFTGYFKQPTTYNGASTGFTTQLVGAGNVDSNSRPLDGYFFGHVYETSEFCIVYYNSHTGSRTYYPQSTWNVDKCDGSYIMPALDFTKTQVFAVQFIYLGYGQASFWIMNPTTNMMTNVHVIQRVNTSTAYTNLGDPSLGFLMFQENEPGVLTVTADAQIGCGSFGLFSEGIPCPSNVRICAESSKTISAETAVISILCDSTFYSLPNHYPIDLDFISTSTDGSKSVTFRVYKSATLAGSVWVTPQPNLVPMSYDITGTLSAVGVYIFGFTLAKVDNSQILLNDLHTHLNSGDVITITAESAANNDVSVVVSSHIH